MQIGVKDGVTTLILIYIYIYILTSIYIYIYYNTCLVCLASSKKPCVTIISQSSIGCHPPPMVVRCFRWSVTPHCFEFCQRLVVPASTLELATSRNAIAKGKVPNSAGVSLEPVKPKKEPPLGESGSRRVSLGRGRTRNERPPIRLQRSIRVNKSSSTSRLRCLRGWKKRGNNSVCRGDLSGTPRNGFSAQDLQFQSILLLWIESRWHKGPQG